MLPPLLLLLGAYLLGSLPFSFLVARFFGVKDVRTVGSGNVGATNVMRSAGKAAGILAFVLDASKGAVAALLAQRMFGEGSALAPAAAASAVVGHMYPVWLGFRGGKGVATYIGVLLGLYWPAAIAFCLTWLLVAAVTRYSSLAALVASAVVPCLLLWIGEARMALLFLVFTVLLFWRHAENIGRLMRGEEGRIGTKKT
jgi:glycerol-3-phosphate acyltransferase PlsY